MIPRPAIFLDRDGTLNRDVGYAHRVEQLELLDNATEGLQRMATLGFKLIITTNQSGIARGYFNEAQMHEFNRALCERLRAGGVEIAAVYFCPFHPTEGLDSYRRDSPLRKPRPGMIELAARENHLDLTASFAIGDKESDVLAGQAAGCRTVLLTTNRIVPQQAQPTLIACDLLEGALAIERAVHETRATARLRLAARAPHQSLSRICDHRRVYP